MRYDDDSKPTLAERYSSAANSSHLRLQDSRCDVDYLIAAGWLKDGLGTMLHRLRAEFDAVRADLRSADTFGPEWEKLIKAAEAAIRDAGSPVPGNLRSEPERLRLEGVNALKAERGLVLIQLKTLTPAREALGRHAQIMAKKIMFLRDERAVATLTGRALDAWLDPICDKCNGVGFKGGCHRGDPKIVCRECHGSKLRKEAVGQDSEERRFVNRLLGEIDQMLAHIEIEMRRFLAQVEATGQVPAGCPVSAAELKQRLVDLRSVQAETD